MTLSSLQRLQETSLFNLCAQHLVPELPQQERGKSGSRTFCSANTILRANVCISTYLCVYTHVSMPVCVFCVHIGARVHPAGRRVSELAAGKRDLPERQSVLDLPRPLVPPARDSSRVQPYRSRLFWRAGMGGQGQSLCRV